MRKRPSRPARFASIDNGAIDSLPSILSIGLLTRLVRAKDGDEVNVESLTKDYAEGEAALSKAMRALVEAALVVKFKVQRAASEAVVDEETGATVVKRGGSWFTTFTVDSIPHTREDVAEMLREILGGGNVKAVRIEPQRLDPRLDVPGPTPVRPTPQNAGVGATCGNAGSGGVAADENTGDSGPRPTPPFATPGRPTPGQGGALIRKKTVVEDSLCDAGGLPAPRGERDAATQHDKATAADVAEAELGEHQEQQPAEEWAQQFARTLPGNLGRASVARLVPGIIEAAAEGWTPEALRAWLVRNVDVSRLAPGAVPGLYFKWLGDRPDAPAGTGSSASVADPCPQHPHREAAACLPCQSGADGAARKAAPSTPAPTGPPPAVAAQLAEALGRMGRPSDEPRHRDEEGRPRRATRAEVEAAQAAEVDANRRAADELLNTQYAR